MDIVRRNTDYALRMMVNLARHYEKGPESTRTVSNEEDVPYQLACKLMQRLTRAKLVESCMGAKGGYQLSKTPSDINILDIIETIQGPLSVNQCMLKINACTRKSGCPVSGKLKGLQENLNNYLSSITLSELALSREDMQGNKSRKKR